MGLLATWLTRWRRWCPLVSPRWLMSTACCPVGCHDDGPTSVLGLIRVYKNKLADSGAFRQMFLCALCGQDVAHNVINKRPVYRKFNQRILTQSPSTSDQLHLTCSSTNVSLNEDSESDQLSSGHRKQLQEMIRKCWLTCYFTVFCICVILSGSLSVSCFILVVSCSYPWLPVLCVVLLTEHVCFTLIIIWGSRKDLKTLGTIRINQLMGITADDMKPASLLEPVMLRFRLALNTLYQVFLFMEHKYWLIYHWFLFLFVFLEVT